MQNYLCDDCGERWETDEKIGICPKCGSVEFRKTMSRKEAEERGLL